MANWVSMLAEMDVNVGAMLDAVDRLRIRDNTIVIFASDNCADRLQAVKWRQYKVHFYQQETMVSPPVKLLVPLLFNLYTNCAANPSIERRDRRSSDVRDRRTATQGSEFNIALSLPIKPIELPSQ